ncbi:MAG: tRNA lysidine(34) synthetase TilS [Planctomycetaceae bacterium]
MLRLSRVAGITADDRFIAALAAAVPAGLWAMPAVVAVSGGADSVGLLLGLLAIAPAATRHRLVVAHAEHDLRAAAADDRAFVERLAAEMGLEVECRRLFVRDAEDQGEGIEARARRLRYDFLEDVARVRGARHVVVGHTADDQAETVLHRVLRGTGLHGLAGMRAARELVPGVSLLRPLLGVPRIVVRDFLARVGQAWCEDESNLDRDYARNFLRHEIIARCEAGPYPDASAAITRLAAQAATASAAIRSAADLILETHTSRHADGSVVMRTQSLAAVDAHLAAELFAAVWQREGWPQRDMTARHYASLAALLRDDSPPAIDLPGGIHARRTVDGFVTLRRGEGMSF